MKTTTLIIAIALISTFTTTAAVKRTKTSTNTYTTVTTDVNALSANDVKTNMRNLGEKQVELTHKLILCIINNQPGLAGILADLNATQVAIGNSIKPFYGTKAGDKLSALLSSNVVILNNLLVAVKTNDITAIDESIEAWKDNGAATAEFYSIINPSIKENNMRAMLFNYMKLTTLEGEARLRNDAVTNLDISNKISTAMITISDKLSNGIVDQFPNKFSADPSMAMATK